MQYDFGKQSEESGIDAGHAPQPQERALREAMASGHGGFEIALAPVFTGGIGWLVDRWLDTSPTFLIIGVILGFVGAIANQYYRYQDAMERERIKRLEAIADKEVASGIAARSFGRVEQVEIDESIDFAVSPKKILQQAEQFRQAQQ